MGLSGQLHRMVALNPNPVKRKLRESDPSNPCHIWSGCL